VGPDPNEAQSESSTQELERGGPRYSSGEQVEVTRIEPPKRKKRKNDGEWFEADDGTRGRLLGNATSNIQIGEKTTLWILSVAGKTYNFGLELPGKQSGPKTKPTHKKQKRGKRR
jgi:hypothetical protein